MTDQLRELEEGARRAVQWTASHQREDGSLTRPEDGIGGYYKVPYLFAATGRLREAQALLDWVSARHMTPGGDFRAPQRRALQAAHDRWPVYANAWIVLGACRAGRWDLAHRGMRFIKSEQSALGAFPARARDGGYLEPVNTAWGGLACLATGCLEEARRAARVLAGLVKAQREPGRFYYRMDESGSLIETVPAGQERSYFVDAGSERQVTYNPGIALIFLAQMARAEGTSAWSEACAALAAFAARCVPAVVRFPPSGKLGYGCALWARSTGDREAARVAAEVGRYLLETQREDGSWRLPDVEPYASRPGRDDFETILDLTAEFGAFLAELSAG